MTQPPPHGPREIAKQIDRAIAYRVDKLGEPEADAVVAERKAWAAVFGKTLAAVKSAHVRHGTRGVASRRKLPR